MTDYGLTILNDTDDQYPITGFVPKTYDDILLSLIDYCQREFGGDIDLTPTSPIYIILQSLAQQYAQMWETLEGLHYAHNLETAEGQDLDNLGLSVALPRYRPTKSRGEMEFTRLRDPVTGVFYRIDSDTGTLVDIPPYIYYYNQYLTNPPCTELTPEILERIKQAKNYADYFTLALPEIVVPEDLTVSLLNGSSIVYRVDASGNIPSDIDSSDAYTVTVPVECTTIGPLGDLDTYYTRSLYFPGSITKIIPNSLNPYINMVATVYQDTGLSSIEVGIAYTDLTINRKDNLSGEMVICNCWHYYDTDKPKPNGNYEYIQVPLNALAVEDIISQIEAARVADSKIPVIEVVTRMVRDYLKTFDTYYTDHRTEAEKVELIWIAPDNITTYNIDFRNMALDDDSTWFIPNPSEEADLLFTYFRPYYDSSGALHPDSLDYLIFRPLTNCSIPPSTETGSFLVLYAGFGGTEEDFYSRDATTDTKGYIGPNHKSVSKGYFLPPKNFDNPTTLYCRPGTYVMSGAKQNIGYALQSHTISGGKEFESDLAYKNRIKTTQYEVSSTGSAIEKMVGDVSGVMAVSVYDALVNLDDPLSIGFKVKIRTEDDQKISPDGLYNTDMGNLVNDLVSLVKPAGVQYTYDYGKGYPVVILLTVVGIEYAHEIIEENIKTALRAFIRSVSPCKPLEYSYLVELLSSYVKGVKVIKNLTVRNGSGGISNQGEDGKYYLSSQYMMDSLDDVVYVEEDSYAYFDEASSQITVLSERVIDYGGCGRSNQCD